MLSGEKQTLLKRYHTLLQANPADDKAHYQLGLFFLKEGEYAYAKIQFKNVLALNEAHLDALFHLGVSLFYLDEYVDAEVCFQQVLKVRSSDIEAWVNLGAIALKKGEGQEAISHFTQALVLDTEHEAAQSNLAATFMHYERYENALTHYEALIQRFPEQMEYLYNLAVAEMTLGLFENAREHFLIVLKNVPRHFAALYNLGVVYFKLKSKVQAQAYLSQALALHPEDANCMHLLAALQGEAPTASASAAYASHLFDSYALYYDKHLCDTLHYQLPAYISGLCHELGINQMENTLDLGCGTGLCAASLRPLSKQLIGVDISAKMLKQAEKKGLYDQLVEQEAVIYLQERTTVFNLIVAADLFPYFGEVTACFEAVNDCLTKGGYFIFSVEESGQAPWAIQATARYAHHPDYIEALCKQNEWQIVRRERKVARKQEEGEVLVRVYVCQK